MAQARLPSKFWYMSMKFLSILCLMSLACPTLAQMTDSERLDAAVKAAITTGDLRHAKELALTREQWEWIADAERGPPKSDADLRLEQRNSDACKQAQRSTDVERSSIRNDYAAVSRKENAEREACGGYLKYR